MLRALGRIHSSGEAERAVKLAQDAGFDNVNLDLMYALPKQSLQGALADVERAIALAPAHISHYQLTLEPNTAFAANPPPLPDDDDAWAMQEACQARLAQAGYAQYEVSAFARVGRHFVLRVSGLDLRRLPRERRGRTREDFGSREPEAESRR